MSQLSEISVSKLEVHLYPKIDKFSVYIQNRKILKTKIF